MTVLSLKIGGLVMALLTLGAPLPEARELPAPTGEIVLTVSGEITRTNIDNAAVFDLEMLAALDATEFSTDTIWTDGIDRYTGVRLDRLLEAVGAQGAVINAVAINDYTVQVPVSDAVPGGPIVAYAMNGKQMSRRHKGPLWLIYPFADRSAYRSEVVFARSIWQLDRMVISE